MLLLIVSISTLKAQRLIDENVVFAKEKIELIKYLGPGFFAVATYNRSICESNSISFIKNGKTISHHDLAETFVKEVFVRNDSIAVSTITMYSDVGGLIGAGIYYFDLEGNYLSNVFGGFDNNAWDHYEELIISDNGENLLIADSTGQIFHFDLSQEKLYPLEHPMPDNPSKPLHLIKADYGMNGWDSDILYIVAYKDLLFSASPAALYGNELYNIKTFSDINFVKHLGYDRILVVHGGQVSILDYHLNEIISNPDVTNAGQWSYEGHYLFGTNDLGPPPLDSSSKMLEVLRIRLSDLTEISRDTILHTLSDIELKGNLDSLFLFGISPDGAQGVYQTYDLSDLTLFTPERTDIAVNLEIIDHQLISQPWNFALNVNAEIEVTNKQPETLDGIRLVYYLSWPQFCGALHTKDEIVSLGQNESSKFNIQLSLYNYAFTDAGDSIEFYMPCIFAYPLLMPYDINTADNIGCKSIKIKRLISSSEASPAEQAKWKIYPNPTNDVFYLDTSDLPDQTIRFSLWNAQGQKIQTWQRSSNVSEISLNSMNIPAGVYWISANNMKDSRSFGSKVLIKR
ncbi:MAG: T9SS type A sorting domain-containing protein [Saprospiraceae bacterium]|nr:T9SS type A sorting domain-containing protein [Saprospiraceae bacterium]